MKVYVKNEVTKQHEEVHIAEDPQAWAYSIGLLALLAALVVTPILLLWH